MLVVSDTSPIRALSHLSLLPLLESLFGSVFVPPAVARELKAYHPLLPALDVDTFSFIRIQAPGSVGLPAQVAGGLHQGEIEAIALALELHAMLLIDEARGRKAAVRLGLTAVGTLGVLGRAKHAGLIASVRPLVDRLMGEIRFFVDRQMVDEFLVRLGE